MENQETQWRPLAYLLLQCGHQHHIACKHRVYDCQEEDCKYVYSGMALQEHNTLCDHCTGKNSYCRLPPQVREAVKASFAAHRKGTDKEALERAAKARARLTDPGYESDGEDAIREETRETFNCPWADNEQTEERAQRLVFLIQNEWKNTGEAGPMTRQQQVIAANRLYNLQRCYNRTPFQYLGHLSARELNDHLESALFELGVAHLWFEQNTIQLFQELFDRAEEHFQRHYQPNNFNNDPELIDILLQPVPVASIDPNEMCSICHESFLMAEDGKAKDVRQLPCGHLFCCLEFWLKDHVTCPMDRRDYTRELTRTVPYELRKALGILCAMDFVKRNEPYA